MLYKRPITPWSKMSRTRRIADAVTHLVDLVNTSQDRELARSWASGAKWLVKVDTGSIVTRSDEALAAMSPYEMSDGVLWCRICDGTGLTHEDDCVWVDASERVQRLYDAS